jgi:integrase
MAFRGLRRGEAVGLPWTNVDLDNGFLTVSTQIVQLGWATEEAAPKSDSEGVVALDRATVEVLRTHRERQQEEADEHPTVWQHTGLVFTREEGTAIHPELVSRTFDRLVRDADLPPIRLHDLRHGAATLALAAGVDLKVVSAMLGHSSITITADTYVSVLPETARAAAEAAAVVVPRRGRQTLLTYIDNSSADRDKGRPTDR